MRLRFPPTLPLPFDRQHRQLLTLHMRYTPLFAPFYQHIKILQENSVLQLPCLDKYQHMPKDTLRWTVSSRTATKTVPLAVGRNQLKTRVQRAVRKALALEGFESDGRIRNPEGKEQAGLQGTWEILCLTRQPLDTDFEELVEVARRGVRAVVAQGPAAKARATEAALGKAWWDVDLVRLTEQAG